MNQEYVSATENDQDTRDHSSRDLPSRDLSGRDRDARGDRRADRIVQYLSALYESGSTTVLVVDHEARVTYASSSVRSLIEVGPQQIVGTWLRQYLHPDDVAAVERRLADLVNGDTAAVNNTLRLRGGDGDWKFVDFTAQRIPGTAVEFVLELIDVTARVLALQEYKDLQKQYGRTQSVARISNWELNTTTGIVTASKQFFRNFGLPVRAEVPFDKVIGLVRDNDRQAVVDAIRKSQKTFEPLDVRFGINGTKDLRVLHVLGEVELVGSDLILFGTVQDVSRSFRLQNKIATSERRLRDLTRRLHEAQEEERKRLAREVHDVLGQSMTALRMDISWIKGRVGESDEVMTQRVDEALNLVQETIQTIRRISHDLRPALLDHFGLAAALEWLCDQFGKRSELDCSFTNDLDEGAIDRLDVDLATALYRIVQESLTNVERHAEASTVAVSLSIADDEQLLMTIRDDGKGIDATDSENTPSLGFLNMRERVLPWQGIVSVEGIVTEGVAAGGTVVEVRVPLSFKTEKGTP